MPTYTIKVFVDSTKDSLAKAGADGWRSKIPWLGSNEQVKATKATVALLESIPKEVQETDDVPAMRKHLLAAGVPEESVRQCAMQFKAAHGMHRWATWRWKRNLPLPATFEDFEFFVHERPMPLEDGEYMKQLWRSLKRKQGE